MQNTIQVELKKEGTNIIIDFQLETAKDLLIDDLKKVQKSINEKLTKIIESESGTDGSTLQSEDDIELMEEETEDVETPKRLRTY